MTKAIENVGTMFEIWNTVNGARQAGLADAALEHNLHFADPRHNIVGREAFLEMVRSTQREFPGAVYARASGVDSHNNYCRYHWSIHKDGVLAMSGFDLVEVSDGGKILKVIGFFGEIRASA